MTTQLAEIKDVNLSLPTGCIYSEVGIAITKKLEFNDCEKLYTCLRSVEDSVQWALGDVLNYAEKVYGEEYAQWIDPLDYKNDTLRYYQYVCERVPLVNRLPPRVIPFSIYKTIAKYDVKEQKKIINKVVEDKMNCRELSDYLKRKDKKEKEVEDAPPIKAMELISDFTRNMKALLEETPLKKWHEDSLSLLKSTYESADLDIRESFKWK